MDKLDEYVRAAHQAVVAASNGQDLANELHLLAPQEAELRIIFDTLNKRPNPAQAAQIHAENAELLRAMQPFLLSWSGGGSEQVMGWDALAKRLRLKQSTIRVLLSKGRGSFSKRSSNPLTAEWDVLTVTRLLVPGLPDVPKKMGRPRTRPWTEQEMADAVQSGTPLASPARTVPKGRNRDTDDSGSPR